MEKCDICEKRTLSSNETEDGRIVCQTCRKRKEVDL